MTSVHDRVKREKSGVKLEHVHVVILTGLLCLVLRSHAERLSIIRRHAPVTATQRPTAVESPKVISIERRLLP
jgi:hypothetical protein